MASILRLSFLRSTRYATSRISRWRNKLSERSTLQFAFILGTEALLIGFLHILLIVGSPFQTESLRIDKLLVALRGEEKVASALAAVEVFVVIPGKALVAWLLYGTEHRSPICIRQVVLLIVGQFTVNRYLLVHIQAAAVLLLIVESRT